MSDMDPLYQSMKASSEDMSLAAKEQREMMTKDDQTDVPITGYGNVRLTPNRFALKLNPLQRTSLQTWQPKRSMNTGMNWS